MSARLILASASPRRKELLSRLGIPFAVVPSDVPEVPLAGEAPASFVRRVASDKARAIAAAYPGLWVLGADTVVVIDAEILGKPVDAAEARAMLTRLSGRRHQVLTGVALVAADGRLCAETAVETAVAFRPLLADEIERYIASGEPFDKAGAYAIQGGAGAFVEGVEGSYSNVVGLPIEEVQVILVAHGLLDGSRPLGESWNPRLGSG